MTAQETTSEDRVEQVALALFRYDNERDPDPASEADGYWVDDQRERARAVLRALGEDA